MIHHELLNSVNRNFKKGGDNVSMLLRYHYQQSDPVEPEKVKNVALDDMTLKDLKSLAKEKGVEGYSTLAKAELLDALKG